MTYYTNTQHGCLPSGTVTDLGTIEQVSLTCYLIEGAWHPFTAIHGPYKPAESLVTCTGEWR
jgi:hypothetical protein